MDYMYALASSKAQEFEEHTNKEDLEDIKKVANKFDDNQRRLKQISSNLNQKRFTK
ncbi:MAG: hypothetical protein K0Q47_54 [Sedimentibacter sp.]|jgi:hypothetical protein|nr:hypothetical protein [Sedimentibacter sp.]